jgi:hypothetical protein
MKYPRQHGMKMNFHFPLDFLIIGMIKLKNLVRGNFPDMDSLFESPMKLNSYDPQQFSSNVENFKFTKKVIELAETHQKYGVYDYYSYKVGINYYDVFVEGEFTVAFFSYTLDKNYFVEKNVWQEGTKIGMCREILFNFYLPKYDGIISDGLHSELGGKYWKKLVKDAKSKGYKTYVISDSGTKIEIEVEDMDKYYGDDTKSLSYRFLISKK